MRILSPHSRLPVEEAIPEILQALSSHDTLLLSAEPGAGKSTIVPLAFLDDSPLAGQKILMLEPRRIAARAVAGRMAALLGEKIGNTVGLRTRAETRCSRATKIEVVTEGVLTRMIQQDPELPGIELIIFDEFHERSIHADLGLALALDVRANLRPDLKLLIMSATLNLPPLKKLLPHAAELHIPGKNFPVRTLYTDLPPNLPEEKAVAITVRNALSAFPGDALVFLPGEGEIRRVQAVLKSLNAFPAPVEILPLFGNLPPEQQDKVFAPKNDPSVRRVILSTSLAETSLTVNEVRIVIDSGWARLPEFSPATGMNRLETCRVSLESADQRRGRAGRTEEGVCIRMWRKEQERSFKEARAPEILESDLCPFLLELLNWGVPPDAVPDFPLPDIPPESHLKRAFQLLLELGAASPEKNITPYGKKLLALGVHPRWAHAILKGIECGAPETAVRMAALLSERDFLRNTQADISLRLDALDIHKNTPDRDENLRAAVLRTASKLRRLLPRNAHGRDDSLLPYLLACACPDRIAGRRKDSSVYTLANGVMAELDKDDPLCRERFLVCPETATLHGKTRIRLAAALSEKEMEQALGGRMEERFEITPEPDKSALRCEKIRAIGSLVLSRKSADAPEKALKKAFFSLLRDRGADALPLSKRDRAFCERVTFLHQLGLEEYPDLSAPALLDSLEDWLGPFTSGFKRLNQLEKINLRTLLENRITAKAHAALKNLAPEHVRVPSGSEIAIDYSNPAQPLIAVRLQELFGMKQTPLLAGGKTRLLIHILSPAMRTVQVTSDLNSFWKNSYFLVRKDLRGRYPKHDWPEDPLQAVAHRGVRKKEKQAAPGR